MITFRRYLLATFFAWLVFQSIGVLAGAVYLISYEAHHRAAGVSPEGVFGLAFTGVFMTLLPAAFFALVTTALCAQAIRRNWPRAASYAIGAVFAAALFVGYASTFGVSIADLATLHSFSDKIPDVRRPGLADNEVPLLVISILAGLAAVRACERILRSAPAVLKADRASALLDSEIPRMSLTRRCFAAIACTWIVAWGAVILAGAAGLALFADKGAGRALQMLIFGPMISMLPSAIFAFLVAPAVALAFEKVWPRWTTRTFAAILGCLLFLWYELGHHSDSPNDKLRMLSACIFAALCAEEVCRKIVHDGLDWCRPKRPVASESPD